MKGFPKVLKTAQDVKNCKTMVDAGQLQAADLLEAIEAIENQNFIICPIRELSEDKKTVTVTYCNEAAAGARVTAGRRDRNRSERGTYRRENRTDPGKQRRKRQRSHFQERSRPVPKRSRSRTHLPFMKR